MNIRFYSGLLSKMLLLTVLLFCWPPMQTAAAEPIRNTAAGRFYDALSPYGKWVEHPLYGEVWYPPDVPADWRPYTDGYWAYTDNYGWLWVSDWPWGWAAFHYGRWVWDDRYGWIWIPGNIWAPAWVFWSDGDGYTSWAPMPPNYLWSPYLTYSLYSFNYDQFVPWFCWVTVRNHDFPRRHHHRRGAFMPPDRNRDILKKNAFFSNMTLVHDNLVNLGIPVKRIEKATGTTLNPIAPEILAQKKEFDQIFRRSRQNDKAVIYRPFAGKPTPEAIQREERRARQIAGLSVLPPAFLAREKSRPEQRKESRLPGKRRPNEYRVEGPPKSSRPERRQPETRLSPFSGTPQELQRGAERQRPAEERLMPSESLGRQKQLTFPSSRRNITVIPWNEGSRQAITQQPEPAPRQRQPGQLGQRGVTVIPWNQERQPEQRQRLRQPSRKQALHKPTPQGRRGVQIIPWNEGGARRFQQRPSTPPVYLRMQPQGPRQIEIQPSNRGSRQITIRGPARVQINRGVQPYRQGQIQIFQGNRSSRQGFGRRAPLFGGKRGSGMHGFYGHGRGR